MELKNNQGILFQNKKEKDSQPDFRGEVNVDGEIYQIALWKKKSKNDNVYLSVRVEPKRESEVKAYNEPKEEHKENFTTYDDLNDEIPFD